MSPAAAPGSIMNLLADALVPYLLSNGIQYKRNQPDMTARQLRSRRQHRIL